MTFSPSRFTGTLARTATWLSLHSSSRKVSSISTGLRIVALRMSLLATESVLLILLLAFGIKSLSAIASSSTRRLSIIILDTNVEEILFVSSCDFCALSF